jgi:hypothetical protein
MSHVNTLEGEWRTTCLQGYRTNEGNPVNLRPLQYGTA